MLAVGAGLISRDIVGEGLKEALIEALIEALGQAELLSNSKAKGVCEAQFELDSDAEWESD